MSIVRKSMLKFQSAFEAGSNTAESESTDQKALRKSDNRSLKRRASNVAAQKEKKS